MGRYIYDNSNGLWYELQDDYYIPCLTIPEEERQQIGVWGRRHLRYIRQHRKALYTELFLSGKLNGYLAKLNEQAGDMLLRSVKEFVKKGRYHRKAQSRESNAWGAADECSTRNGNGDRQS